jgi:hypothetical protein
MTPVLLAKRSGAVKRARRQVARVYLEWRLLMRPRVQGRITIAQLPLAEKSFPGISEMYAKLHEKPATFLQLVWIYESTMRKAAQADQETEEGGSSGN